MLTPTFLDWWFAPWAYAGTGSTVLGLATDTLGLRDAYPIWCDAHQVDTAFPDSFDPAWQHAAATDASLFETAAGLFGGLISARANDQKVLRAISQEQRRWCMSVAITQPLQPWSGWTELGSDVTGEAHVVRGLIELVRRIEPACPGMWSRLRLLVAPDTAAQVDAAYERIRTSGAPELGNVQRAQRCWSMCVAHALRLKKQSTNESQLAQQQAA